MIVFADLGTCVFIVIVVLIILTNEKVGAFFLFWFRDGCRVATEIGTFHGPQTKHTQRLPVKPPDFTNCQKLLPKISHSVSNSSLFLKIPKNFEDMAILSYLNFIINSTRVQISIAVF